MANSNFTVNESRKPSNFVDIAGQEFGLWTAISYSGNGKWNCICGCGEVRDVKTYDLKSGKSKCCGCLHSERLRKRNHRHGFATRENTKPEYKTWAWMISRCNNPNDTAYHHYGGRGIGVCPEWLDFQKFYKDMGDRPSPKHSIERIDNDGNYDPSNCRWATSVEQASNTRKTRTLTFKGQTRTLSEWARELGVGVPTLCNRLRRGWCDDCALGIPIGATHGTKTPTCFHQIDQVYIPYRKSL